MWEFQTVVEDGVDGRLMDLLALFVVVVPAQAVAVAVALCDIAAFVNDFFNFPFVPKTSWSILCLKESWNF